MTSHDFDDDEQLCPLCMEEMDATDRNFKPCSCGYQMCSFCWNHIKENLNARCPHCRKPYDEVNYTFVPPKQEDEQARKDRAKSKDKKRDSDLRRNLANIRVVQRNLVYITNLALASAKEDLLKKHEYFGQYGKILKVVVNKTNLYNVDAPDGPSVSAYITYIKKDDALKSILAVNGAWLDNKQLRASFGTTKYCSFFLRNQTCTNPDCMYLHELGDEKDSFTKEEMAAGKHLLLPEVIMQPFTPQPGKPGLPPPPILVKDLKENPLKSSDSKIKLNETSTIAPEPKRPEPAGTVTAPPTTTTPPPSSVTPPPTTPSPAPTAISASSSKSSVLLDSGPLPQSTTPPPFNIKESKSVDMSKPVWSIPTAVPKPATPAVVPNEVWPTLGSAPPVKPPAAPTTPLLRTSIDQKAQPTLPPGSALPATASWASNKKQEVPLTSSGASTTKAEEELSQSKPVDTASPPPAAAQPEPVVEQPAPAPAPTPVKEKSSKKKNKSPKKTASPSPPPETAPSEPVQAEPVPAEPTPANGNVGVHPMWKSELYVEETDEIILPVANGHVARLEESLSKKLNIESTTEVKPAEKSLLAQLLGQQVFDQPAETTPPQVKTPPPSTATQSNGWSFATFQSNFWSNHHAGHPQEEPVVATETYDTWGDSAVGLVDVLLGDGTKAKREAPPGFNNINNNNNMNNINVNNNNNNNPMDPLLWRFQNAEYQRPSQSRFNFAQEVAAKEEQMANFRSSYEPAYYQQQQQHNNFNVPPAQPTIPANNSSIPAAEEWFRALLPHANISVSSSFTGQQQPQQQQVPAPYPGPNAGPMWNGNNSQAKWNQAPPNSNPYMNQQWMGNGPAGAPMPPPGFEPKPAWNAGHAQPYAPHTNDPNFFSGNSNNNNAPVPDSIWGKPSSQVPMHPMNPQMMQQQQQQQSFQSYGFVDPAIVNSGPTFMDDANRPPWGAAPTAYRPFSFPIQNPQPQQPNMNISMMNNMAQSGFPFGAQQPAAPVPSSSMVHRLGQSKPYSFDAAKETVTTKTSTTTTTTTTTTTMTTTTTNKPTIDEEAIDLVNNLLKGPSPSNSTSSSKEEEPKKKTNKKKKKDKKKEEVARVVVQDSNPIPQFESPRQKIESLALNSDFSVKSIPSLNSANSLNLNGNAQLNAVVDTLMNGDSKAKNSKKSATSLNTSTEIEKLEKEVANAKKEVKGWEDKLKELKIRNQEFDTITKM